MKPTEKAISVLTPVLDWLERGAPHVNVQGLEIGFNMSSVDSESQSGCIDDNIDWETNSCGTACCMAGAAVKFSPREFTSRAQPERGGDGVELCEVIGEELGMDEEDIHQLFIPVGQVPFRAFSEISPEAAAKALRGYLETGEVRWEF